MEGHRVMVGRRQIVEGPVGLCKNLGLYFE